jgi:site-specific DNA-methyltransferase (adenine-specific)
VIELINADCDNLLPAFPDGFFDFGIFDPPYNLKEDGKKNDTRGLKAKTGKYPHRGWDDKQPGAETFAQIQRVCKHWAIFGANYYKPLGEPFKTPRREQYTDWLDSLGQKNGNTDFNDFELALTNFPDRPTIRAPFKWQGMLQGDMKYKQKRIHPTEKPIPLYAWIFRTYTTPGMKVIDAFLGSGASAIAAHYAELDFTGIEKHPGIYLDAKTRFDKIILQTKLL